LTLAREEGRVGKIKKMEKTVKLNFSVINNEITQSKIENKSQQKSTLQKNSFRRKKRQRPLHPITAVRH
jgi:hypothetical protein